MGDKGFIVTYQISNNPNALLHTDLVTEFDLSTIDGFRKYNLYMFKRYGNSVTSYNLIIHFIKELK